MTQALEIQDLSVQIENKTILNNFSLVIPSGEIHALMGPNGMGKSSLAKALAGHPDYNITSGQILLNGQNIIGLEPEKIAKLGLFLAFQYPPALPGVSVANFIRQAMKCHSENECMLCSNAKASCKNSLNEQKNVLDGPHSSFSPKQFYAKLYENMDILKIDRSFSSRSLNEGFSGGEKKRCEVLQMLMLEPNFVVLDEIDSGLDIDSLQVTSEAINNLKKSRNTGILLITHYSRILNILKPDRIHILNNGSISQSGDMSLIHKLEKQGYEYVNNN